MPKIFANNKHWMRGGHMNQKRHIEMTDGEKANIALCTGNKDEHPCKNPIFRCSDCGNYGCDQEFSDKCSDQGFKNDKCLHCGAMATRIPVMKEEFAKYITAWEKEVPII